MEAQAAHGQSVVVLVKVDELDLAVQAVRGSEGLSALLQSGDIAAPVIISPVTMLSVVMERMRETADVASRFTGTLGALGINILAVTEGTRSLTAVIKGENTPRAVRGVHAAFNLSRQVCSVLVVGAEIGQGRYGSSTAASSLVRTLQKQCDRLARCHSLELRLVGAYVKGLKPLGMGGAKKSQGTGAYT
jgi:hypothetical protein